MWVAARASRAMIISTMMIVTEQGRRYVPRDSIVHITPHRHEGSHAFLSIHLRTGETLSGIAKVDEIEALVLNWHAHEPPPMAA